MTFLLGQTLWRVHPALPVLWLCAGFAGGWTAAAASFFALLLHECGHLLAARRLGMTVQEAEVTPLGGVMRVKDLDASAPGPLFLLAAAGPIFSVLGCFLAAEMNRLGAPYVFCRCFARMNLLLALMNLLPALPLDGGRMLHAALCRFFSPGRAAKWLTNAGRVLGAALCGLSLLSALRGRALLAPCFAGLYLIYAAALEGRRGAARYVTSLIARRQRLERGEILPVACLAAAADTPALSVLPHLRPGRCHVILVLSPDGLRRVAIFDEETLCEKLLNEPDAPLLPPDQKETQTKNGCGQPS